MNGDASFGDECGQVTAIVAAQEASISKPRRKDATTNGMTALMVAVGGSSLACYWLMTRVQNAAVVVATRPATTPVTAVAVSFRRRWIVFNSFSGGSD
jgi:hypothetical protein